MPATRLPRRCPCGTGDLYVDCCGPLHAGRSAGEPTAPTAERLMRSRFSAFAIGDADYLLATWHRSTRPRSFDLGPEVEWRQLEIRGSVDGGEDDDTGTVDFVAYYWDVEDERRGMQQEHSRFVREGGQWYYVGLAD